MTKQQALDAYGLAYDLFLDIAESDFDGGAKAEQVCLRLWDLALDLGATENDLYGAQDALLD